MASVAIDEAWTHRQTAVATDPGAGLESTALFDEPFLAVLPVGHALARKKRLDPEALAGDLLVLADGHCLAVQALSACGRGGRSGRAFLAASLDTLVNLVAAGYGVTLIPGLAESAMRGREVVVRPLTGTVSRTIRLAGRPGFPRPRALEALSRAIRGVYPPA